MSQTKKPEIRRAILTGAYDLFRQKGYATTTTAQIAKRAKVSESNVYVYFDSKAQILFEIYEPWLRERVIALRRKLAKVEAPRERVRLILKLLWQRLPSDEGGFSNNLMQCLSTLSRTGHYKSELLLSVEKDIEEMILSSAPEERRDQIRHGRLVHILMMAQDGFVMNYHLDPKNRAQSASVELMCDFILGPERSGKGARTARPNAPPAQRSASVRRSAPAR
ncbi:MAG: TetR/AcrR family transcriptional regulator [Pseudorhodoplanes sp.]|uniref:TetR/AcrR family transcriptional regulator n=1 Tax=Pseudorhodoplanes sp. TaxID=1934341 RepID=UPI003D1082FE